MLKPPSILMTSPVCQRAASLIRYTAMAPKSSGTPHRRIGMRGITLSTNLSQVNNRSVIAVSIQPGMTALALIL